MMCLDGVKHQTDNNVNKAGTEDKHSLTNVKLPPNIKFQKTFKRIILLFRSYVPSEFLEIHITGSISHGPK